MLCLTMSIAAVGVFIFIYAGVRWESMQKLLKEGEFSPHEKNKSGIKGTIGLVYWLLLTAAYLTWSFLTNDWHITWIIYAVGGVLFAALMAICDIFIKRKDE